MNTLFEFGNPEIQELILMSFKGALLLGLAGVAVKMLNRASAARRHLIWMCALSGVTVLTVLSLVGPSLPVPILKRSGTDNISDQEITVSVQPETISLPNAIPSKVNEPSPQIEHQSIVELPVERAVTPPPTSDPAKTLAEGLLVGWGLLIAMVLLPRFFGVVALKRIRQKARLSEDGYWDELLQRACSKLRIKRKIILLEHPGPIIPMTWGFFRPRVLIPTTARQWQAEQQEAMLLHELAHVKRWDCLTRMVARVGLALHAFNPLAWLAWRHLRIESERSCDDRVIAAGLDPTRYAEQLLQIAQGYNASRWATSKAFPMARKSQLEGRIYALLDQKRSRSGLGRRGVCLSLIIALVVVVPVSVIKLVAVAAPASTEMEQTTPGMRHFVRLVVGIEKLTFEGEALTWEQLDQRLEQVDDRSSTVLEIAMDSEDLTIRQWREAKMKTQMLSLKHEFEYLSEIGLHPLGSKGSPSQVRSPEDLSKLRDDAISKGFLIRALDMEMQRVLQRRETGHAYKDKISLDTVWEDYVKQNKPGPIEIQELVKEVEAWGGEHRDDSEYSWRVSHLLSSIAENLGSYDAAKRWMNQAVESYPETRYTEPSKHSKFQHLVNDLAGLIWVQEGPEAAARRAIELFQGDERFEYFYLAWWENQCEQHELEESYARFQKQVLEAYRKRLKEFPDRAEITRRYLNRLSSQLSSEKNKDTPAPIPADEIPAKQADPIGVSESRSSNSSNNPLQSLIDEADPGGIVEIPKGTHTEPLRINKPLTLRGVQSAFSMLKVRSDEPAIHILTTEPVIIENLTIEWERVTSQARGASMAVTMQDGQVTIRNCQFSGDEGIRRCPVAVGILGLSTVRIQNCVFSGFNFTVEFSGGARGIVEDCIFVNAGHCAVTAGNGTEVTVLRTLVTGSDYHGLRCTGGTLNAKDNLIIANKNRGIYLGNRPAHGLIKNNVIHGNATGISAFGGSDSVIENNLFLENTFAAIDARAHCPIIIRENILQGNAQGFVMWNKSAATPAVRLGENTYWQNKTNDVSNINLPKGSLKADPEFTASNQGDFTRQGNQTHGLSNPDIHRSLWEKWKRIQSL